MTALEDLAAQLEAARERILTLEAEKASVVEFRLSDANRALICALQADRDQQWMSANDLRDEVTRLTALNDSLSAELVRLLVLEALSGFKPVRGE